MKVFVNMATDYTRQWIQFFTGCGIPEDVATTYGLIFNENRIQKNMLLDLNKEYLRDMGITIMGDIIAILRHAKVVHDKFVREKILIESKEKVIGNHAMDNADIKKTTPMKQILEHYTRKCGGSELDVPHEQVQIQSENENSLMNICNKLPHQVGIQNKATVKKKIEAPSIICDVPMQNVRRVLPENEGSYKIKMPSGTTEGSKKILQKGKLKQSKTVFDRLGESSVSSTSDVTTASAPALQIVKCSGSKEKNLSSVFARLGEKSPLVTSTSSNGDSAVCNEQLPYRGILKTRSDRKELRFSPGSTMRADNEFKKSHISDTNIKNTNLKERLGTKGKPVEVPSPRGSIKLNRLQITTTFEEALEIEPSHGKMLSTRFKSINMLTAGNKEKKAIDCFDGFRSEIIQNKSRVSSTTLLREGKNRGTKRRLENRESVASEPSDTSDPARSKRVRFGRTTQRLIPGNSVMTGATKEYPNLTMMVGNEVAESKKSNKFTLASGVTIGPMSSDKIRQKLSLKERIGSASLPSKSGRMATDLKRKRSLKLPNIIKNISIHDRLG